MFCFPSHMYPHMLVDPPLLLEHPREVVLAHPGGMARLFLNMTGGPWPKVTWYHVPATRGRVRLLRESGPQSR